MVYFQCVLRRSSCGKQPSARWHPFLLGTSALLPFWLSSRVQARGVDPQHRGQEEGAILFRSQEAQVKPLTTWDHD